MWDITKGILLRNLKTSYVTSPYVNSLAVTPDITKIVAICADSSVKRSIKGGLAAYTYGLSYLFYNPEIINVWDIPTGNLLHKLKSKRTFYPNSVAVTPDNNKIVAGANNNQGVGY